MANNVICPKCGELIELSEALQKQIANEIRKKAQEEIRKEIEEKSRIEILDLKKALNEKEGKIAEFRTIELRLREEKRRLEEKEKELALEVNRKIDEERKKIEEVAIRQTLEQHHKENLEKDKIILDLKKSLEEAQRKAQQTSQQLQGEVMELDLERSLKSNFPDDNIEPVGKGAKGADLRQFVRSSRGNPCGVILWEVKMTKSWSDDWLTKLKSDLRSEGADIPVIVSNAIPEEAKNGIGLKNGVWVTSFSLAIPLAHALRKTLVEVARQKWIESKKEEKSDFLYKYITGKEFSQQIESLAEVYMEMQTQITKEKAAFEKIWKARESQAKRIMHSTVSIWGSIQGTIGLSMPQIKNLDIPELESGLEKGGEE